MYSAGKIEEWKESFVPYAKRLYESGITDTDDVSGAVENTGTTPKKSFHRCLDDKNVWEVKAVSPGLL
jgi:hypothetical protein